MVARKLHAHDNVAIALADLLQGSPALGLPVTEEIPFGFKFATEPIARGAMVKRYGYPIGFATADIRPGALIHSHNLAMGALLDADVTPADRIVFPQAPEISDRSFMGYVRPDGSVGTKNVILLLSTVNCSAFVVHEAARQAKAKGNLPRNVDDIVAISHSRGCGIAPGTESAAMMARTLAGFAKHPNVGACIIVGLGCEKGQPNLITEPHGLIQLTWKGQSIGVELPSHNRPLVVKIQDLGGTEETIAAILDAVERLLPVLGAMRRTKVPAAKLRLATQCGGSDGFSGITANPLIGAVSDLLVRCGGVSFLTETTETFGAGHVITSRAVNEDVARRYLGFVEWYKRYLIARGGNFDSNPSFGNKEGGITTIAEKALGSVLKSGTSPFSWVIDYAEPIPGPGLGFMNGPAYDPAGATGQFASGATIMLFSTGRGSAFGSKLAAVGKVASNSRLAQRMSRDMDINAGRLLEGVSLEALAEETFTWLLKVASGELNTWSGFHGYGDHEIVLWDTGPMT